MLYGLFPNDLCMMETAYNFDELLLNLWNQLNASSKVLYKGQPYSFFAKFHAGDKYNALCQVKTKINGCFFAMIHTMDN